MAKPKARQGGSYRPDWPSQANKRTYYLGSILVAGVAHRAETHHGGNESKAAQELIRAGLKAVSATTGEGNEEDREVGNE